MRYRKKSKTQPLGEQMYKIVNLDTYRFTRGLHTTRNEKKADTYPTITAALEMIKNLPAAELWIPVALTA